MKKVMLLIYSSPFHFPPTINAANLLAEKGVEVHLLGLRINDNWSQQLNPGVKLVYLGDQRTGIRGIIQYFRSVLFLRRYLKLQGITSLLGYDAKSVLPAFLATCSSRTRWFFHQHDFWEKPKGIWEWFVWNMERRLLKYAAHTSFPQMERAEYFRKTAKLRNMPDIVFNGPRRSWLLKNTAPSPVITGFRERFDYILVYQGGWSAFFGLERIFHALALCKTNTALVMLGEEREPGIRNSFQAELQRLGIIHRVYLADKYIPYEELPGFTRYCDAAIAILTRDDDAAPFNNRYLIGASNKITEYIACGLPVLIQDSEPNRRFFSRYSIGVLIDSDDPGRFAKQIDAILEDREKRETIGNDNRRLFLEELNFDTQFRKIADKF